MNLFNFLMRVIVVLIFSTLFLPNSKANNIQVTNISLENLNEAQNWVQVQFDVNWENSWRISAGPANWDAAWLIVKYRSNNGEWNHAVLNQSDFVAPTGSTVQVSPDNVGALIYRDSDGSGDVNFNQVNLRWDYGTSISTSDILDVQVFAMEMVYVPESAFYIGTGSTGTGTEANQFYMGGNSTSPFQVSSESAITISNSAGNLYYNSNDFLNAGDQTGVLSNNFPKGFAGFYCLKYEVTQSQFVNYFNTLSETQKVINDLTSVPGKNTDALVDRNGVSWLDTGNATTTHPDVPVNYISTISVLAFLDWAGLRPMTELEFEKSCRGPLTPVPGEFAWGSTNITNDAYTLINDAQPNEAIAVLPENTGNASYSYGIINGPLRNGIFAASSVNNTREETGGSYYGIMELSGNLYERCITVGNIEGRTFTGNHGNGSLTATGEQNVTTWPLNEKGIGYRAGSFFNVSISLRVSDRNDASNPIESGTRLGFRGVRTAF